MNIERAVFQIELDREAQVTRSALSTCLPITISTDRVIDMGGTLERLDHSLGAVDLSRAQDGGLPFLEQHDPGRLPLGRVSDVRTDGHRLRGNLKLGAHPRAKQIAADVESGVIRHVSVGYKVLARHRVGQVMHVDRWAPHEVSAVAVPADTAAQIGRSFSQPIQTRSFPMSTELSSRFLDLSPADKRRYSLSRALLSMSNPGVFNADFERECSAELAARNNTHPRGLYIPDDAFSLSERELDTTGTAGEIVATKLLAGDFIELLRNQTAVLKLGATVLPDQVGNLVIPRQDSAATVQWVGEGAPATESDQTFDQVSSSPKTMSAWTQYSRRTLLQATPAIDALIRDDLTRVISIELDRAAISGTGASNQPTGLLNVSGIGSVALGANGGAPTWAAVLQLIEQLANANALRGKLGFLTNTRVVSTLEQTPKIGTTFPEFILDEPYTTLVGYPIKASNNIPNTFTKGTGSGLSALIFGNWADLIIPFWGPPIDLLSDPYSLSTQGSVKLIAFSSLDIQVRHAVSFAADVDIIAS